MMLSHLCLPCMYKLHYLLQLWSSFCIQFLDSRTDAKLVNTASLGEALSLFLAALADLYPTLVRGWVTATFKYGQKRVTLDPGCILLIRVMNWRIPKSPICQFQDLIYLNPELWTQGSFALLQCFLNGWLDCDLESSFDIVDRRL